MKTIPMNTTTTIHKAKKSVTPSPAMAPASDVIQQHLESLAANRPDIVTLLDLGFSHLGRPLQAVEINHRAFPDHQKQHVLIVAGQHGNEESSRMVALAAIDHLVSEAGQRYLEKQKIVILPNANPDGCEADTYPNAQGLLVNMDHAPAGHATTEARAIGTLFEQYAPDLYIDCHSCGHTGFGNDMVLYPITRKYSEDDNLVHQIAADMVLAAENEGIPQYTHTLGWWASDENETSSTLQAYQKYKSLVFLIENCEDNSGSYPEQMRKASGLAKILAAMEYGQVKDKSCAYPGYPNQLITGMRNLCIVAAGETAASRRQSRVEAWRQVSHFSLGYAMPIAEQTKKFKLNYTGASIGAVGVQARITGKWQVQSLLLNNKLLSSSKTDGWQVFYDHCSTYVHVTLPALIAGTYEFHLELI